MINKLIENIKKTNAPIVVGLDPTLKFVPEYIKQEAFARHGETLEGAAEAVWQYNKGIVDAICDLVPAVKPQSAMYEQFGVPGMAVFKRTVDYCQEKGLVVIGDVKRGDIGSTSEAYAVGHLGRTGVGGSSISAFGEDFVTVNPYLGSDGVKPFMKVCAGWREGGGVERRMYAGERRLQLCGCGSGSDLSRTGQAAPQGDAQVLYPGARLRGSGREGCRSGAFL